MALLKDIQTPFGLVAAYWKITFMDLTYATPDVQQRTGCILRGWQNQTDRETHQPIADRAFVWFGDDVPADRAEAYAKIKLNYEFADSTDA